MRCRRKRGCECPCEFMARGPSHSRGGRVAGRDVEGYLDRDPGLAKRLEGGMREEGGRSSKADAEGRTEDDKTRAKMRTCAVGT